MSDLKKECPSCAMEIDRESEECPICGYEFPPRSRQNWITIAALLFLAIIILSFLYIMF